jgi:drug/metabolite transporter (DMT)-like permease
VSGTDLLAVLASVTLVVIGQTTLKWAMTIVGVIDRPRLREPLKLAADVARVWQVWFGLSVYVLSAAMWIFALSRVPLSMAYPFLGLSYVGVAVVAVVALKEWLTPAQWLGIAAVVAGVVMVAAS